MEHTIVSRTYGTLHKGRRSARQAFYFIKYILIKNIQKIQNGRVYTVHLNVQICVYILCRILIFKGLNSQFKIAATTKYITRIKDWTKN